MISKSHKIMFSLVMQMLAELKETNCLLKSEKDELNRLIQEQSQQITGRYTLLLSLYL